MSGTENGRDVDGDSEADADWSLVAVGDCCLDTERAGEGDCDDPELLAPGLGERVTDAALSVVNLEAPVETPDSEPIPKSGPALSTPAETPRWLRDAGFDVTTLANNHLADHGVPGIRATVDACEATGLRTAGVGENRSDALEPASVRIAVGADDESGESGESRAVDVAVLSACEREFGVAGPDDPGTAWSAHPSALDAVEAAAATHDVVVVVEHGGIEYVPFSPPDRRVRLRRFVDAGADLVVGHHPHVVQGWERYEGAFVFHSLGNFLFDRQDGGENTGWGLAVEVEFRGARPVGAELIPVETVDGTVHELGVRRSRTDHLAHLFRLADLTGDDERFRGLWQAVAVRAFHERYSNWLLTGVGERLVDARANPTDPAAQRPLWDVDRRRTELLTLLNVVRNESHRATVTTALELFAGESTDERTPEIESLVDDLLAWTRR